VTKRAFDVVLAGAVLILASPLIGASALAVRVTMGRGVWFRQQRAGLDGRPITVLKLRTMTDDRDETGHLLSDDRRLTRLGRFLRKTSIDELPQMLNVLRGTLSMVGPRPLPLAYVERYSAEERRRLDAKPGITGWAQINGRNAIAWQEKLRLDVWYVDNMSLLVDLRIVVRTLGAVFGRADVSAAGNATMPEFTGEP
jgi:lipopolysaccharide/colanic/teichoic acid biosynthesis glycosyltransferase